MVFVVCLLWVFLILSGKKRVEGGWGRECARGEKVLVMSAPIAMETEHF